MDNKERARGRAVLWFVVPYALLYTFWLIFPRETFMFAALALIALLVLFYRAGSERAGGRDRAD